MDHDKTPVPTPSALTKTQSSSTISRLESKYSDILSRISKRKENLNNEDRDKTLEPEKPLYGLTKSATTILSSASSLAKGTPAKERTPYRLTDRSRNKYLDKLSSNDRLSSRSSKTKSDHDFGSTDDFYDHHNYGRYDHYHSNLTKSDRNKYDNGISSYKSKYDPDTLASELSNRNDDSPSSSSNRRQLKSYRNSNKNSSERRHTTNYKLLPIDIDNDVSSKYSRGISSSSSYSQRKSGASGRISQTQKFFDSEKLLSSPSSRVSATNNNILSSIDDDEDKENDGELTEREAKRKEIRSLIMKYAQMDDNYNRATAKEDENNNKIMSKSDASGTSTAGGKKSYESSVGGGSAALAMSSSASSMAGAYGPKLVSYGGIRKTATTSSFSDAYHDRTFLDVYHPRSSRISKALQSFVRY